jgi:hypothetical protein
MQLYRYFVSQSSEFCRHNPLCCFSTSVCCLFRYRLSPETFGYTLVLFTYCKGISVPLQNIIQRLICYKYEYSWSVYGLHLVRKVDNFTFLPVPLYL